MKYKIDHDYHIHSHLSVCSSDPLQTNESILQYAIKSGLKSICLTDHHWDEKVEKINEGWASGFYQKQDYAYICQAKPLPQSENVTFLFGCEAEMDMNNKIGISKERLDAFDFIIIPTTHLHMNKFSVSEADYQNPERLAKLWIERIDALLDMDLPFYKIGLAHPVCILMNNASEEAYLSTIELINKDEMRRIWKKAAIKGLGIEINAEDVYRIIKYKAVCDVFRMAKECGCKFYLGSDAHHPVNFENCIRQFERAIELLNLEESDKFYIGK